MHSQNDLIKWKTDAWKDPGMVSWYSGRMVENSGTMPLKHALEVGLCAAHARGARILDVGIGTGRASLPLAREGKSVTGIDSSQAMLDETRRLAGETPITLQLGDVETLPFADGEFDTLLALNVAVHFPHWRRLLAEWQRVVRPDGRIVFDLHSLDNYRFAQGAQVNEADLLEETHRLGDFSAYTLRVAVADLVAEADRQGLSVVAVVPYGAFLGGGNANYLMSDTLEKQHAWLRRLSWLAADERLLAFALFIEQQLVAHLTSRVCGRYMVVLEKRADPAANQAWLERNNAIDGLLAQGDTCDELLRLTGIDGNEFAAGLNTHLHASSRNFAFYATLTRELMASGWDDALAALLDAENATRLQAWRSKEEQDRQAVAMARHWGDFPAMKNALDYKGVSMSGAMEYLLLSHVLTDYLQAIPGEQA